MLRRLEKKGLKHESLERDKNDPAWTLNVKRGVAAAFELSWEELSEEAQQLGCLLSLFALAPIPWDLVESVETGQDAENLEDARIELESLHLVQGEETYRLHQLIRDFFQQKLAHSEREDEFKRAFASAIAAQAEQIPQMPTRNLIVALSPLIPHLEEVANYLTEYLTDEALGLPFQGLGWFYEGQGFYDQAEPWRRQCLTTTQDRFGCEHPDVATSLNNLAYLYRTQGNYSEAEPLYVQALELRKFLLGEQHPDVAESFNNLAELYYSQSRYSEAEPLLMQALELRKLLVGEEHPDVALSLNNLAYFYRTQGRYSEAETLYIQALEVKKRQLGEEHPSIATSLNNLAALYYFQDRYTDAEPLYVQALALRQRLLGEEHPDVAASLNNLARLYEAQGCYSKGQLFYVQAMAICKQRLGSAHPLTVKIQENFVTFLRQAIAQGCADLESLPDNPTIEAILAEVQASLEQSE
jgi:tetratricopeptide (TPR) repeat protein